MQKVDFNMVPIWDYNNLSEEQVTFFSRLIEQVKERDKVLIPQEFYTEKGKDGRDIMEALSENSNSLNHLLYQIIFKQTTTEEKYATILVNLQIKETALTGIRDNYDNKYKTDYTVCDKAEIAKVKRRFIKRYTTYEEFIARAEECYPNLVFHERCFDSIHLLGHYKDNIVELDRNLSALNDYGAVLYKEANGNEADAIRRLESKCSVTCSGKGSKEDKPYKIEYILKKKIGKESKEKLELTCNPHLKLFSKYTDKRIYFCWGRQEIEAHKIIIAKIGDHGL